MATSTGNERAARRLWPLFWVVCAGLFGCSALGPQPAPLQRFEYEHGQMGTLFRIVLYASAVEHADSSAAAAFALLDEINAQQSDYEAESELSRLSRASEAEVPTPWIEVSPALYSVLARAREVASASDGAFDVTCGVATRLWRRAIREHELPDPESIRAARASVDWRALELAPDACRVRWTKPGARLDLGGIAKGYALDRMLALLDARGLSSAMVVGGGDIVVGDAPPGARGWRVEIMSPTPVEEGPRPMLELSRAAVSSSGDLYRSAMIAGLRYSHIVDPRTAMGLTTSTGASVIAPDGTTADALATAAVVLGPQGSVLLWERFENCHFRIAVAGANGLECVESPGFKQFCVP